MGGHSDGRASGRDPRWQKWLECFGELANPYSIRWCSAYVIEQSDDDVVRMGRPLSVDSRPACDHRQFGLVQEGAAFILG